MAPEKISLISMSNQKARAHIFVSGRVQGVFFRDSTQRKARELGLTGWVRNLPDGRVEIVLEGEREKIEVMLSWLKKGPPLAKVKDIQLEWQEYKGEWI